MKYEINHNALYITEYEISSHHLIFDDLEAKYLAQILENNNSLTSLNLGYNNVAGGNWEGC